MGHIVVEHILRDVVGKLAPIVINGNNLQPQFGWGDKKELNRWLQVKQEAAYPLIWLLPSKDSYKRGGIEVEKNCTFIIATREDRKDLFNDQRYIRSFDVILNPLLDAFIAKMNLINASELRKDEWDIFKYPNYSEADENGTIDLWDAIKLDIEVIFNKHKIC